MDGGSPASAIGFKPEGPYSSTLEPAGGGVADSSAYGAQLIVDKVVPARTDCPINPSTSGRSAGLKAEDIARARGPPQTRPKRLGIILPGQELSTRDTLFCADLECNSTCADGEELSKTCLAASSPLFLLA